MAVPLWNRPGAQIAAAIVGLYLLLMDIILMLRLQAASTASGSPTPAPTSASPAPTATPRWWDMFLPDPAVKGLFMDPLNQHLFMPLAMLTEAVLDLHRSAPWLSPDAISASHVAVAACGMRLIACWDSLATRQAGVLLFQVRFFLDALDGVVARARKNTGLSDPGIGSHGNLVDGVCDLAGTVCLLLGLFVLLRAHKQCSTARAARVLGEWAVLLAVSSLSWNAAISRYHDLLEAADEPGYGERAIAVGCGSLWLVSWLWRLLNPHALTATLLASVFLDKHLEWATWARRRLFLLVFCLILLTEVQLNLTRAALRVTQ